MKIGSWSSGMQQGVGGKCCWGVWMDKHKPAPTYPKERSPQCSVTAGNQPVPTRAGNVCPSHHQLPQDILFAFTLRVFLCCKALGKGLL